MPVSPHRLRADREAGLGQSGQGLGLGGRGPGALGRRALDHAQRVRPEEQRTPRRHGRVLLAQRAGGRVAGVDEEPLARVGLSLVHRVELGDRHVDLAAHLEPLGVRAACLGELIGHVLHRRHIGGDVLAGDAVATRGGLDEPSPLVRERHGHAVDLGLAGEVERRQVELGVLATQAFGPGAQLVLVERVVEAHHGYTVAHFGEEARRRGADGVGGRVGCGQRREVGLELAQLAHQQVVLGVGDLGRVEHVVQLVVVEDLRPQVRCPRQRPGGRRVGRLGRHRQRTMPAPSTASGSASS